MRTRRESDGLLEGRRRAERDNGIEARRWSAPARLRKQANQVGWALDDVLLVRYN